MAQTQGKRQFRWGWGEGEVSHKKSVASSSGLVGGGWWQERQSHLSRGCKTIGALQMGGGEKGAGKRWPGGECHVRGARNKQQMCRLRKLESVVTEAMVWKAMARGSSQHWLHS